MSCKELISRDVFLVEPRTDISISKTSSNLVPTLRIHHMILQPAREPIKPVLSIPSSGDTVAAIRLGDNKGKYEDDEKESYKNGHATEIESQKSLLVPVSSEKATERD